MKKTVAQTPVRRIRDRSGGGADHQTAGDRHRHPLTSRAALSAPQPATRGHLISADAWSLALIDEPVPSHKGLLAMSTRPSTRPST